MKKVLILVPGYLPGFKNGGPVRTVANMVDALGDEISFSVVCLDRDLGDKQPYKNIKRHDWNQQGKARVYYIARGLQGVLKMIVLLRSSKFDVIHLNSFLSFQFSILPIFLLMILGVKVPLILGPRGEFSQGALSIKSTKKSFFIGIAKLLKLYRKVIWHASSPHEADDVRRVMGQDVNIRIATDIAASTSNTSIPKRDSSQPLKIAFVSRVSPMKNLDFAIGILTGIKEYVIFDVYGPLEDKTYWEQCEQCARTLPDNIQFNYLGSLQPDTVIPTLSNYDLFFLPSKGENFGHAIAEALFSGLPVLISDQTPWRQLIDNKLGWDLPLSDKSAFESAIKQCMEYSTVDYYAWRSHIRDWALKNIGNKEAVDATRQLFSFK